ncbi:MAG: tRNA pseudouridine32 synthase/23S rRNA pseudouridine746 synthase [Flavobacteriales bacterium]
MKRSSADSLFIPLTIPEDVSSRPYRLVSPFSPTPHFIAKLAASDLQKRLTESFADEHNFGFDKNSVLPVIGKMFGVLVVEFEGEIGYLSAFSGKIAGSNDHPGFVPPIFNLLASGGFLNEGMTELGRMGEEISRLQEEDKERNQEQIITLKTARKQHSVHLQNKIFDHYEFLNQAGETSNIRSIFQSLGHKNPPAGAGECAAPKLFQFAFEKGMRPLAMAEFWWGESPKSDFWKHKQYYPSCKEKCEPILGFMLQGIEIEG